ncbi:septum formation initiator family protein [Streptococcus sp. X16XC17]|uniref:septum formation initiator family protein n=1 Tax=unclassified Streptococcus TaxID=2608887 RepID=UPI00066FBE26|nr:MULTISPECIES: septum formation initiator family protein [unclassified Streptococcus]TCD45489.1 septum formation initiator family protein [Streptococcus sp. X16XC17]
MRNSKVLQFNNAYIQDEYRKKQIREEENRKKNRFMGSILILAVFLFVLPTYNLVESYNSLKQKEQQLVDLNNRYQELSEEEELESSLVKKLGDNDFAAKYVRAKYQYSKEGEFVYNIPGLLPK